MMNASRLKMIIDAIDFELLNEWEEKFIEDIESFYNTKGYLTEKQEKVLEEIYKKKSR